MLNPSGLIAQHATASTAGSLLCSTALTSPLELSFALNPALLANDSSRSVCIGSAPGPYGLKDLALHRLSVHSEIVPSVHGGLLISLFGGSLYSELQTQLSVGYALNASTQLGTSLRCTRSSARDYAPQQILCLDAALRLDLNPSSRLCTTIQNCTRNGNDLSVDQEMHLGYGFKVDEDLSVESDLVLALNRNSALLCAAHYQWLRQLGSRLAYHSAKRSMEFDLDLQLSPSLRLDALCLWQSTLGSSFSGGLAWFW